MRDFKDINIGLILFYCCRIKIVTERIYARNAHAAPLLNITSCLLLLESIREMIFKTTYLFCKTITIQFFFLKNRLFYFN